jgi:branched-chain amino acid aminotransferase
VSSQIGGDDARIVLHALGRPVKFAELSIRNIVDSFGYYDMFLIDHDGTGWKNARVVPYGPLPLDPAAAALHYGQTLFEGMKAYRAKNGRALVFRPQLHAARLNASAERLCMPSLPEETFDAALRAYMDAHRTA